MHPSCSLPPFSPPPPLLVLSYAATLLDPIFRGRQRSVVNRHYSWKNLPRHVCLFGEGACVWLRERERETCVCVCLWVERGGIVSVFAATDARSHRHSSSMRENVLFARTLRLSHSRSLSCSLSLAPVLSPSFTVSLSLSLSLSLPLFIIPSNTSVFLRPFPHKSLSHLPNHSHSHTHKRIHRGQPRSRSISPAFSLSPSPYLRLGRSLALRM